MRSNARIALLAPFVGAIFALLAPAAAQAAGEVPVIEKLVASNCKVKTCGQEEVEPGFFEPKAKVTVGEAEAEGFTEAGGRVPYGTTDFKVLTIPGGKYSTGTVVPTLRVTHIRTDVAAGLATNPFAVKQCSLAEFGEETLPTSELFKAPTAECNASKIGTNEVTVYAGAAGDQALSGEVYDLVPGANETMANGAKPSSLYGVALKLPKYLTEPKLTAAFAEHPLPEAEFKGATKGIREAEKKGTEEALIKEQWYAHTLIKGNVEWGKEARGTEAGDYHDYFEIAVSPELPLIRSRLTFEGNIGTGDFITNATSCPGHNTTSLKVTDLEGNEAPVKMFTTPIGLSGCSLVPFEPTFALTPETKQQDQPDGITTELAVPHNPTKVDSSQLNNASIVLPEGMTLNPSAAAGLEACTPAQARIQSSTFGVACPEKSKLGTVALNVPTLPAGSLTGNMYLGGPESGPITGPPYTMYINVQSTQYGVDVRLEGTVTPNATTGRLTTTFLKNPEQPFNNITLTFTQGALAPVANPLTCGTASTETSLTQYANPAVLASPMTSFAVDSNGTGGACPNPLPFALTQSTVNQSPGYAGAKTAYTLNLQRADGQQYLSQIKTVLPAGLVGLIPAVTKCGEPQANNGECTAASQIGTVSVSAGAGSKPYGYKGNVYLTGPYGGAPFGMSIVVPAVAGPFNLGNVVTRGTINVEPYTARVVATSTLPTIVKGVPLRLKGISVEINRQGFLVNPTSCGAEATETTLTGFAQLGVAGTATQSLSNPFQVSNCSALAFKPSFGSASGAKTSKANGASLETTLNMPAGDANVKSVVVQLPRQLPSRLTTLQKACTEAVFNANPYNCPSGSFVGGVRANTPTLAAKLKGPAILVSHGGAAFPDLDLLLEGEGIRVILVGNTNIKNGITTTTFAAPPDVPVTSITVNLPIGAHSALTANGNLCANKLAMPTTIVSQNGKTFKQTTTIRVNNCPVRITGHKVIGNTAYITVQTYAAGRVSGSGPNVNTVYRRLASAEKTATIKIPLSNRGRHRGRPLRVKLRVGFVPKAHNITRSAATITVTFR